MITRLIRNTGIGFFAVCALAACSNNAKNTLGLNKAAPDEFRVIAKSPLVIPPDFSLRPPLVHTMANTQNGGEAKDMLLGQNIAANEVNVATAGEEALLNKSSVRTIDPAIRQIIAQDNMPPAPLPQKENFLKKLLPSDAKEPTLGPDSVVDASAEKARLEQNRKEGKPVTEGETPTIAEEVTPLDKLLGKDKESE